MPTLPSNKAEVGEVSEGSECGPDETFAHHKVVFRLIAA